MSGKNHAPTASGARNGADPHRPLPWTPSWSAPPEADQQFVRPAAWPADTGRDWAWGGSTGRGVSVCVIDSGIDPSSERVAPIAGTFAVSEVDGRLQIVPDEEGDVAGHGTACAGIVRALAPESAIFSLRVLGSHNRGSGPVLLTGLRWAIEQEFDVINLSLSTTKSEIVEALRQLADAAYFRRSLVVASAHNLLVESYPWQFSSVISVARHGGDDPFQFFYNPRPPVEFFARGVQVPVPCVGGGETRVTGNSFATPHVAAIAALIRAKHTHMRPFELKCALYLTATNIERRRR